MPIRKRYLPEEEAKPVNYDTTLPHHLPVAVYYRQSTIQQVGNTATEIQTVDMIEHMKQMGWEEDKITLVDMDAGISGTKKIDERLGMRELFRLITTDSIGAVSCQDEDRLFRDVTQIQVNIFIEACKEHNVLVITPGVVYNFSHPQMGTFHARQFRFKSEMAAEYIETFVKGRLHRAIRRIAATGRWTGAQMPAGYMVDNGKTLPSGLENPNYYRFVIYEPYAEVVREYWRLFLHFGGQIRTTLDHISANGPYYPNLNICQPPEGYRVVYRLGEHNDKWYPTTRTGLKQMFTNAMYIGHWMIKGRVVIWDNHPAIIDLDTFMRGFNYLSDRALDGTSNLHYNPVMAYRKASKIEERDESWPLCAGLFFGCEDGNWMRVGVRWNKLSNAYFYNFLSKKIEKPLWRKKVAFIDGPIIELLRKKLKATFDFNSWEDALSKTEKRIQEEQNLYQEQINQLQTVMDNLIANLATLKHPQMIKAVEKQYADAEREYQRLQQELASDQDETITVEQVRGLRDSCGEIFSNWEKTTPDEKREILHTFIQRIEGTPFGRNGLNLRIFWKDGSEDELSIPDQSGPYMTWTEGETERLIYLLESGVDQLEIGKAFPNRKWSALMVRYRSKVEPENRVKYKGKRSIRKTESYNDYLKRVKPDGGDEGDDEIDIQSDSHLSNSVRNALDIAQ